ncbi:GNAT family N-acetyltransferase [Microvirga alba]|uniref:GNAT family N-acetyltransferase n=1 Tax=Microvirga alba TaxID=2791025 RepID=A0A931BTU0_9HYPH|nr:GNAT family N-acetyltransferase [Microvirga alba]MBF9232697.1 GNAT family N-acetyltransferase [Microvirga alba]
MRVRPANTADIPALAIIAEHSYREAFKTILEEDVLATRDAAFFAARFAGSWDRTILVEEGTPLGFLLMTDGHIDMLFMDPDASGKGAGTLLLREAEAAGAKSLECFRDNQGARRFYERHGWRIAREYDREFAGKNRSFVFYVKDGVGSPTAL